MTARRCRPAARTASAWRISAPACSACMARMPCSRSPTARRGGCWSPCRCLTGRPEMIRALIVDDEPLARRNVTAMLADEADIEVIGECASGGEAAARIRAERPDLVFLDVEMPDGDGFEVLEALGCDLPPAVVYVTAYDRYALRAFEIGAIDYLLKPFDQARFAKVLARARDWIAQEKSRDTRLAVKS